MAQHPLGRVGFSAERMLRGWRLVAQQLQGGPDDDQIRLRLDFNAMF